MRIVVNDIAAVSGGAMTVLKQFYNYVCELSDGNEWIFLLADKFFEETDTVKIISMPKIKKSKIRKLIFDFFTGKRFIKKLDPDVVFSLQNIITFGVKVPQLTYMHQSIPYQTEKKFSFLKKSELKLAVIQRLIGRIIDKSVKRADGVIVQSQWIKDAICKKTGISENKITVARPLADDLTCFLDGETWDNRRFFYPSSDYIYKNNDVILAAARDLKSKGESGFKVKLTISRNDDTEGVVEFVGTIEKRQVAKEYKRATLIFPSYIETVGLPLLEARRIGTVILAADTPFAREMLYGYENAFFFPTFDYKKLSDLMAKVINGEIEKKETEFIQGDNPWESVVGAIYAAKK